MNIGEWTRKWADRYPDEPSIKYGELILTKREFDTRINRTANGLLQMGVRKGDRIAAIMANSNVFLEILFAISKIGAVMVPLNFRLAVPELDYIINNSEPSLMFYSPEFTSVVEELKPKITTVNQFICEEGTVLEGDLLYETWAAEFPGSQPTPPEEPTLDDPHIIMYTSGTTGRPKGAVITQGNTQWNAINCIHMYNFDVKNVGLCCAPLFHIGALNASATPSIYAGCFYVIQRFFDPSGIIKLIEEEKVSSMFGIPVMFLMISVSPEFKEADLSSIEFFIAGGSPCAKSLIETYLEKGISFNQGYGLTETATAVTALRTEDALAKLGSCGKPVIHTEIRIIDAEGNPCKDNEKGEILVKGPHVINEYWKQPKATSSTIVDGWLYTGDIGYTDSEGYLYIVDRRKDMYISGGENVYPSEVEDVLMSFPKIADAGVIGIPDDRWGEVGLAVVVRQPETELTETEIIEFCSGKLAKYKIPQKVEFTDALPRTLTGKILKKDMREMYINK